MIKSLSNNAKDGYVKQKQSESREWKKANIEFAIDEEELDKAVKAAIDKTMKKYFK